MTQRPVYRVKEGEKVLISVSPRVDYLVVEAFKQALLEKNCQVDIVLIDSSIFEPGPADGVDEIRAMARVGEFLTGSRFLQGRFLARFPSPIPAGNLDSQIGRYCFLVV